MSFKASFLLYLFILLFSFNAQAGQEKMIFAIDVIRHGDRTPVKALPNALVKWPQGLGQLTARGMQQEFQLGTSMRKRYIEESHLLPEQYQSETLYVRSSDFDRTLMSAESLLFGLYPLGTGPSLPQSNSPALPSAYQPIPIHTIPLKQDSLLAIDSHSPKYQQLLEKYLFTQAIWKKKTAELQPQFARFSQLSGMRISNLIDLIPLGDNLYIRQLYQVPLPKGMTENEAKTIIDNSRWAFVQAFKVPALGQAAGHELLATIAAYFEKAAHKKTKLKFILFSGHDTSILSLRSAMSAPMDSQPSYASDLSFTLFETEPGKFVVKLRFNGEPFKVPACGGTVCTLSQLEALARS